MRDVISLTLLSLYCFSEHPQPIVKQDVKAISSFTDKCREHECLGMFTVTELVGRVSKIAVKARAYKKKTGKLVVEEEEEEEATHSEPQMDIAPDSEEILDFGQETAATSLGTCTLAQSIVLLFLCKRTSH